MANNKATEKAQKVATPVAEQPQPPVATPVVEQPQAPVVEQPQAPVSTGEFEWRCLTCGKATPIPLEQNISFCYASST